MADVEALIGFQLCEQAVLAHNRNLLAAVSVAGRRLVEQLEPAVFNSLVAALQEVCYDEGYNVAGQGTVDTRLCIVKSGCEPRPSVCIR